MRPGTHAFQKRTSKATSDGLQFHSQPNPRYKREGISYAFCKRQSISGGTMRKSTRGLVVGLVFAAALLGGCAGTVKNMQEAAPDAAVPVPQPGKAMVVFMRPSGMGFAIQSSVFEVKEEVRPELAGIVAAKTKIAYQVDPGQRLFMVIGESADFITADLVAGRTYYAYVAPRMGFWKARFALEPKSKQDLESDTFKADLQECRWVVVTPQSFQWMQENMASIHSKRTEYYKDWQEKPAEERLRLLAEDGR